MKQATAKDILTALIAISDDRIWATELALSSGDRLIDFWTLEPAASQMFRASAYEIKISRADFKRDTEDKQSEALSWSDRFWYVTPSGLLKRDEIPSWAGLQEWDGERFRVCKRAPMLTKRDPTWEFVVSVLRNCGESRRDTGLMKAQLAYFQSHAEQQREQANIRNRMTFDRWIRRSSKPPLPETGDLTPDNAGLVSGGGK